VWHDNPAHAVNAVLEALGKNGDEAVIVDGKTKSLRDWLTFDREVTRLTRRSSRSTQRAPATRN